MIHGKWLPVALAAILWGCGPSVEAPQPPVAAAAPAAPAAAPGTPQLAFPVDCTVGSGCEVQHYVDDDPGPGVRDYRGGRRTYDGHNGVDIRIADMAAQRAGVAVLAAAPGRVARLRDGAPDVSVREAGVDSVKGRECGGGVVIDHGGGWETQYCHLAQGSLAVKAGDVVVAGQPIARVGLSGLTEFAHLHMSVRRDGVVVDPFRPSPGAAPLWTQAALTRLAYKSGAVLNTGFASGPVTMQAIEDGTVQPADATSPALVAYARAIGLEAGDEVELVLKGPDGAVVAQSRSPPLDRDKAQHFLFVGKKRPPQGWSSGLYRADYAVWRGGKAALKHSFEAQF